MDNTVLKALALLETLSLQTRPIRLTHLAEELQFSKSGTHRLLQTLQQAGYVHQPFGGTRYAATLRLWKIGSQVFKRLDVTAAAKPAMRRLAERFGSTVYLARLDAPVITYLDRLVGSHISPQTEIGDQAPVYCTATGKVLLAWQEPDKVDELLDGSMHAFTPQTITTTSDLRANLARVRADGFAFQSAEWHPCEYAVAAPIFAGGGEVVAAIGLSEVSVPNLRAAIHGIAPAVMAAGREISNNLQARTA